MAEIVTDYQVWRYRKSLDIISEHELIADGYSEAGAEQLCAECNRDTLCESVDHCLRGMADDLSDFEYYIRRRNEPSYLLYNIFPSECKKLYEVVYHKKTSDKKIKLLETIAGKLATSGGPKIIPAVEERDDSDDRGEGESGMPALISDDEADDINVRILPSFSLLSAFLGGLDDEDNID